MFEILPVRDVLVDRFGNLYPVRRAGHVVSSGGNFALPFHEIEKARGEDFLDGLFKSAIALVNGFRSAFSGRTIELERNRFAVFGSRLFVDRG